MVLASSLKEGSSHCLLAYSTGICVGVCVTKPLLQVLMCWWSDLHLDVNVSFCLMFFKEQSFSFNWRPQQIHICVCVKETAGSHDLLLELWSPFQMSKKKMQKWKVETHWGLVAFTQMVFFGLQPTIELCYIQYFRRQNKTTVCQPFTYHGWVVGICSICGKL